MSKSFDLEDRLIAFAVRIIRATQLLPKTTAGMHISGQLVRCGTAPAANYGEAQDAESRADFIHKVKICLKELRETKVWLRIMEEANLARTSLPLERLINENNELIAIFVKSVQTAQKNRGNIECRISNRRMSK